MTRRGIARRLMTVSALALMGGAGAIAGISEGWAQGTISLSPAGGWSVSKMEQSGNAAPYCALTRTYAKDVIFTLGKNINDEYSLAVDFQNPKLDPDKPYKLTLRADGSQERSFNLMPMTPRTMVIRLGWDESFFNALQSSKALRVGIGDEDYSFSMPDIAKGQTDLGNCVSGLKASQAPQQPAGDILAKTDVLNADPGAASEGFSARKVETPAEEPRTAGAAPEIKPFAPAAKAETPVEKAEAVPAPAVKPLPSKKPEIALAAALPPDAKKTPRAPASPDMLREISALKTENDRLSKALESERSKLEELYKTQDSNALTELQEKIRLLEQDKARLSASGTSPAAAAAPAAPVVASADAAAPAAEDTAKIQAMEKQVAALTTEKEDLKKQLAAIEAAAGKDDGLKNKVASLEASLAQVRADKARLESDVAVLRREADVPPEESTEEKAALKRVAELEKQLQSSETAAEKTLSDSKAETEALRQELTALQQGLKKDGSETQKTLTQLQKDHVAKVSELASVRAQLATAQEELDKARELDDTAVAALREEAKAAKAALDVKTTEMAALEAELKKIREKLSDDTAVTALRDEVKTATADLTEKDAKIAALEEDLKKAREELAQARSASQENLTTAQQEQIETKQALAAKTSEIDKLKAETEAAKVRLETELTAVRAKLTEAEARVAAAEAKAGTQATQSEKEMAAIRQDAESKAAELAALQAALDEAKKEAETARAEAAKEAEAAAQGQKSADQLDLVSREIETLKRELLEAENQSESLLRQNKMIKAELDKSVNKLAQADSKIQQAEILKKENLEIRAELAQVEKKSRSVETKISSIEAELKKARATAALESGRRRESEDTAAALNAIEPTYGHDPAPDAKKNASPDFGFGDVTSLLSRAGVLVQGKVNRLSEAGAAMQIYGWKTKTLFGRAEVSRFTGAFQDQIDAHLEQAKGRCKGDFAALPSAESKDSANYEVACVSDKGSTSASLVFFKNKGDFVAIAHETAPENMDLAMDARDQVAQRR